MANMEGVNIVVTFSNNEMVYQMLHNLLEVGT